MLPAKADIITPNLTGVSILLKKDFNFEPLTSAQAKSLLARLGEQGPEFVAITGVQLSDGAFSNLGYDRERGAYWRVDCDYVPVSYPGTGDIFASVLTGALLTGDSLPIAIDRATRFIELTIKTTYSYGMDPSKARRNVGENIKMADRKRIIRQLQGFVNCRELEVNIC